MAVMVSEKGILDINPSRAENIQAIDVLGPPKNESYIAE